VDMELFPSLEIGWMNGWILLCLWYIVQGLSLLAVSKDVRARLFEFDRSSWRKTQRVSFAAGKFVALVFLIVVVFTPIKLNTREFLTGFIVFTVGLLGLAVSIYNFQKIPLNTPVAIGLYRYSRHPQLVMLLIIGVGLSIALNSWFLLLLRIVSFGFEHPGVIAEENECLERFGDSYKEYLESVPRYLFV
jgi:protein-S-isoprenylcysteine O-methyltransferase Ste14